MKVDRLNSRRIMISDKEQLLAANELFNNLARRKFRSKSILTVAKANLSRVQHNETNVILQPNILFNVLIISFTA